MPETEVKEIAVREAKQILTGNGNAAKEQLEKAVRQTHRLLRIRFGPITHRMHSGLR
jgi:Holliday junction resolvasome RuvABC endonuclease subunit